MADTTRILTIDWLERMTSSVNGNPRYRVHFTDGTSAPTQPDTMWAYGAENREYRDVPLEVTFNGRGHVTYAKPDVINGCPVIWRKGIAAIIDHPNAGFMVYLGHRVGERKTLKGAIALAERNLTKEN